MLHGANQSRTNGTKNAFGTMCKFDVRDNRSPEQRVADVDTHKRMIQASLKGDWELYTQLQQSLN